MDASVRQRVLVAALSLSAAAFVGITADEGYTSSPIIPVKGDRPTLGFGSTFYEDGTPVKMTDKPITPQRAVRLAQAHLAKEEVLFRKSLTAVALSQDEYDVYMDWVYQYGTGAWTASSMRRELLAGNYRGACDALLAYRFVGKPPDRYDCSTTVNGQPNKRCWGVWERQLRRHQKCTAAL